MSEEAVRLQKFIADAGFCSRRAAEALIAQSEVWVNGKVAKAGQKITPGVDKVVVSGTHVRPQSQPKMTLVVNKPRGLICSNDDPHNPETVFTLVPKILAKWRFFCAGRLDKDSEGLVILTTDGDLANRLMHPSHHVVKRYYVSLKQPFPATRLPLLVKGIVVEGERLKVERAALVNASKAGESTDLDLHMQHGKKREIRQLLTVLGFDVKRLRRYQIGSIRLAGIPLRGGRQLSNKEIEQLFHSPLTPKSEWMATTETLLHGKSGTKRPTPAATNSSTSAVANRPPPFLP